MAKAGITIAISGTYNGRALERARQDLEKMKISAVSELGGAGSSLVNFGAAAAKVGGELHNMGYKMEQIGAAATRSITVPIVAAAAACGAAAIDIDTSLTNVKKTVDGTEEQYRQLKEAAIEFSRTNAVSPSQILDIQSLGAQLGFAIDELDEFSQVVSGLDIATNMDADTAATEMAQFANITRMAHSDVRNYGSAIVGLGNNMATTEADISRMAMRLAAAGTQVGMSQADILGLAAALSSMGVEAEAGGSAISTIMSRIDKDVARGTEGLRKWADAAGVSVDEMIAHISAGDDWAKEFAASQGKTLKQITQETIGSLEGLEAWASAAKMSAEDFAAAWERDPVQALAVLLSGMEEATEAGGNMALMLEELGIESIRQTDVMKRLAGNSELVTEAVDLSNRAWEENAALQKEVDNRNESMASRFQILQNRVGAVAEKIGTPLVNALLEVIDASEPLLEAVGDIAQSFADMDDEDQKMILGLAAAAAAFGPVMIGAGKVTQTIGDLVVGFGRGAQALGVLGNELGMVASATSAQIGPTLSLGQAVGTLGATNLPMLTGAIGALKVAMVGLGIGAAIVAIGAIVKGLMDWHEHNRKVEQATTGLTEAIDAAQDAYDAYSEGAESAAKSLKEIRDQTDECIESQARLAESMAEQWADYGTNAAMVDAYAKEIQALTQKYDEHGNRLRLTEEEQQRLRLAVDGFNDATGASIEIVDSLNGTLDTSTESIYATVEAFKAQARAQAAMEMYQDLYKQQIENEMALADATAELTRLKELEGDTWNWASGCVTPYAVEVSDAERQVEELTAAMESNQEAMDQIIGVMIASGATFDSFESALESAGVSMEDFGDITEGQLESLRSSFDGTLASIVTACSEQGVEIPSSLASAISGNASVAEDAASSLGEDVSAGVASGIESGADEPANAVRDMAQRIADTFAEQMEIQSPSKVMSDMGENIDLGLKEGIEANGTEATAAMESLGDLIRGAVEDLPEWMSALGSDAGSSLSSGLDSLSSSVRGSGGKLSDSGKAGANPLVSALGGIGHNAGSSLVDGLDSRAPAAKGAGGSLYSSAKSGANPVISALGGIGSQAASRFSTAIGNASAYGSGQRLAGTAKSGLGSVSAYGAGSNFASSFSSGMGGVDVWSAAYSIGRSALGAIKSALGIASPSKEARKVGEWFGEGTALGMRSTIVDIEAESRRMAAAMMPDVDLMGFWASPASPRRPIQGHAESKQETVVNNYYIDGGMVSADGQLADALAIVAERVSGRRRMGAV